MNSSPPSSGVLENFVCRQQLQGQKVVDLFNKLLVQDCITEDGIQECLKNLVKFCQQVITNKKNLKDSSSIKSISKILSVIKHASVQFSCLTQNSTPTFSGNVKPEESQLIKEITLSVKRIDNIFSARSQQKDKITFPPFPPSTEMRNLLSVLKKDDEKSNFKFDASNISQEWQELSNPANTEFVPLQGRHVTKKRFRNSTYPNSPFDRTEKSVISIKPANNSKSITCPEEEYLDILKRSSDLIEAAHKILLKAQKASPLQKSNDNSSLKILRKHLNEAIISFDVSAANLVQYSDNDDSRKEHLLRCSINLVDCIKKTKTFLKDLKNARKSIKSKSSLSTSSENEISVSGINSSKSSFAITVSPTPSEISEPASFDSDNANTTFVITGHPINTLCLEEITKLLKSAISNKDGLVFEKQVNDITDYQESMKTFVVGIIKRKNSNKNPLNSLFEKSNQSTRELLRKARDIYRSATTTNTSKNDDFEGLYRISCDWCKQQSMFIDHTWNLMSPWTKLLEPLFALKQYDDSMKNKVKSALFNEWMVQFKEINQSIIKLSTEFEGVELSIADEHYIDGQAYSQIRIHNSIFELKGYTTKLLQLSKLYLLDDVKPFEWLSFGLWLFHWANTIEHILFLIDGSIHVYEGHGFSFNRITKEHEKWTKIAGELRRSSQDPVLIDNLEKSTKDTIATYKSFTDDFEHFYENLDLKKARLIILLQRWKFEIHHLSGLIRCGTKFVSKAVESLIATALNTTTENMVESLTTFQCYHPIFMKKMERIRLHTCLAVDKATCRKSVHNVIQHLDEFDETSEKLFNLCTQVQATPSAKDSLYTSIYSMQIQWLSEANYLLYLLRQLPDVRYSAISALMRHLQTDKDMSNPYEFIDVITEEEHFSEVNSAYQSLSSRLDGKTSNSEYDSVYSTWAGETAGEYEDISVDGFYIEEYKDRDDVVDGSVMMSTLLPEGIPPNFSKNSIKKQQQQQGFRPSVSPKPTNYEKKLHQQHQQKKCETGDTRCGESNVYSPQRIAAAENNTMNVVVRKKHSESVSKSIAAAARLLRDEADKWEDENNSIIQVVKLMAKQMFEMAEYTKGRGSLRSKNDLVDTAKAIAANAKTVAKFATIVAEECNDDSCRSDLLHYAELVPTLSTQLRIVASVKSVNPNDETTDTMLMINAGNLMKGVVGTLRSAEAASIKISRSSYDEENADVRQSVDLAFQWKRKVRLKRTVDKHCARKDENGLRLSKEMSLPSLTDLLVLNGDSSLYDVLFDKHKEY